MSLFLLTSVIFPFQMCVPRVCVCSLVCVSFRCRNQDGSSFHVVGTSSFQALSGTSLGPFAGVEAGVVKWSFRWMCHRRNHCGSPYGFHFRYDGRDVFSEICLVFCQTWSQFLHLWVSIFHAKHYWPQPRHSNVWDTLRDSKNLCEKPGRPGTWSQILEKWGQRCGCPYKFVLIHWTRQHANCNSLLGFGHQCSCSVHTCSCAIPHEEEWAENFP